MLYQDEIVFPCSCLSLRFSYGVRTWFKNDSVKNTKAFGMTTKRKWHWRAFVLLPVYVSILAQVPVISALCSTTLQKQKSLTTKIITTLHNQGLANNVFLPSKQLDRYSGFVEAGKLIQRYITVTVFDTPGRIHIGKNRTVAPYRFAVQRFLHIDALRLQLGSDGTPSDAVELSLEWNLLYTTVAGHEGLFSMSDTGIITDIFFSFQSFTKSYSLEGAVEGQVNRFGGTLIILKTQLDSELHTRSRHRFLAHQACARNYSFGMLEQRPKISIGQSTSSMTRKYVSPLTHLRKILVEMHYSVEDLSTFGRTHHRITKRSIESLALHKHGRGGKTAIYASMMTVMRKRVLDWESTVPRPIMLLTWVTLFAICILLGVVLAFIKIVTMTAPEQSWHDCVIQQLLDMVYKYEKEKPSSEWSDSGEAADLVNTVEQERGKTSKNILQGTIRVVSFILVAFYEGNLYNSITISKTGAVTNAVDDLLAISRRVKLYEDPEGIHNLTTKLYKDRGQDLRLPSTLQDCISWTDGSFSRGCIAYEFDPRNLPTGSGKYRFQKQEMWKKFPSVHLKRSSHPVASLIQPLAQFCQWMVETWTFHAWNSLEKMFYLRRNTSLGPEMIEIGRLNSDSMLGVRDYLGLLFIYVFLSFLAIVVFFGEVIFSRVRAWCREKTLKGIRKAFIDYGSLVAARVRRGCRSLKRAVVKRRKACLKVKRFVNNIV